MKSPVELFVVVVLVLIVVVVLRGVGLVGADEGAVVDDETVGVTVAQFDEGVVVPLQYAEFDEHLCIVGSNTVP